MSTEAIYNYRKVNDQLITAGQPTAAQVRSAAEEGFRIVINLATIDPRYSLADEAGLVRSLGMTYYHLPVEWGNPLESDFEAFEDLMKALPAEKTLIHCAANFRVTAFYSLYAQKYLGWSDDQAEAFRVSIWEGSDDLVWASFIDRMQSLITGLNMSDRDEVAMTNQKLWEDEVKKGGGYTIPWLDIDITTLQHYAQGKLALLPEPLTCMYPADFLADVRGKEVLCLASGGGQQSAVFGLLGAQVTVVDLTAGQLAGDRKAAAHYGYPITTLQADMRDLAVLDDNAFDLIYQANSVAYIPDIKELYLGVGRVLKSGGLYRVCVSQPVTHRVEWDGKAYFIANPYAEKVYRRPAGVGIEFRHYMDDLFNGLLDLGFSIKRIYEAPYAHLPHYLNAPLGSWNHERSYVAGEFVIVARNEKTF